MAKGLTKRQREVLTFLIDCIRERGMPPTIDEIGRHFGIISTNGVSDHLLALEKKGYIERTSKARSIHITEKARAGLYAHEAGTLPLVGRIAAGSPILAEENVEGSVVVAGDLSRPNAYCLRVQGDSMIGAGILDGDTLVVDPGTPARQGDVVVALLEDEATVKRYFRHGDMVELRPENPAMSPLLVPAAQVQLQGVVVALQRSLS